MAVQGLGLWIAFVYAVLPFHITALLTGGNARLEALSALHETRLVPTHSFQKLPGVVASHFQLRSAATAGGSGTSRSSLRQDKGEGDDDKLKRREKSAIEDKGKGDDDKRTPPAKSAIEDKGEGDDDKLTPREKSAIEDVVAGDYDKVDLAPPKKVELEDPPPAKDWPTFAIHEFRRLFKESLLISILGFFISMLLVAIVAYFYARWKTEPLESEAERQRLRAEFVDGKFRHGLFTCMEDPKMSVFTCICMPIRWGDTMRMGGMIPFWSATMMFAMFTSMWTVTCGLSLIVTLAMTTMRRQEIRSLFGMTHGTYYSRAEDCCTYMWCSCCAVVQEARQLESAYAAQHAGLYGKVPHLVLRNK